MIKRTTILVLAIVSLCLAAFGGQITERAMKPQDHFQWMKDVVHAVNNRSLGSAGIAINSGAKAKFDLGNDIVVINSGVFNSVGASTANTFDAPVAVVPASKRCLFIVGVNASDEVITKQSPVVSYDHQLVLPLLPEGVAPVALIKVVVAADGIFTPNTTALDNTSCTITLTNIAQTPVSLDVNQR